MSARKNKGALDLSAGRPSQKSRMEGFDELAVVCLSQDFRSAAGVIPKGTVATVLQVFDDGRAYQVEFEGPYEAPETVLASYLEAKRAQPA